MRPVKKRKINIINPIELNMRTFLNFRNIEIVLFKFDMTAKFMKDWAKYAMDMKKKETPKIFSWLL
ncbi:hypothetical protein GF327_07090 [Candidatus Woesearchaeota archaeon]|nr:hypothetical protein [Candidatus Woesearchaeota archaeon]